MGQKLQNIEAQLRWLNFNSDFTEMPIHVETEIRLLIQLNKITEKTPISTKIYLSMILEKYTSFMNAKIYFFSFLGKLLGYRI